MISSCSPPWYDQFLHSGSWTSFASWIAHADFQSKLAAAGQSIAVAKQVQAGLGRHISTLTVSQIEDYQKVGFSVQTYEQKEFSQLTYYVEQTGYAAQLLYILALCLPKFAVLHFLSTIAITKTCRITRKGIVSANLLWTFVAIIIIASQCPSSRPWAILSDQCSDQVSLSKLGARSLLRIQVACDMGFHWDR